MPVEWFRSHLSSPLSPHDDSESIQQLPFGILATRTTEHFLISSDKSEREKAHSPASSLQSLLGRRLRTPFRKVWVCVTLTECYSNLLSYMSSPFGRHDGIRTRVQHGGYSISSSSMSWPTSRHYGAIQKHSSGLVTHLKHPSLSSDSNWDLLRTGSPGCKPAYRQAGAASLLYFSKRHFGASANSIHAHAWRTRHLPGKCTESINFYRSTSFYARERNYRQLHFGQMKPTTSRYWLELCQTSPELSEFRLVVSNHSPISTEAPDLPLRSIAVLGRIELPTFA